MRHLLSACVAGLFTATATAQLAPTCMLFDAGFVTNSLGGSVQTADGGVAFCGSHDEGNSGYSDIVVTKLDATGALQWMKSFDTGQTFAE